MLIAHVVNSVCAFPDPLWPVSTVARRGPTPSLCPAAMKMTLTLATASPTQEKVNKVTSPVNFGRINTQGS